MQKNHQKIENILILRTSSLGDICHMLPFINTLIKEYPKANKYWVIGKEEADGALEIWEKLLGVVEKGEHRPGNFQAIKISN